MSTVLHEQGFNSAWIEMQLAHTDKTAFVVHTTMLVTLKEDEK